MVLKDGVALMWTEVRCDRTAASAVRGTIGGLDHLGWLADDAMLVASELVTNLWGTSRACGYHVWAELAKR